MDAMATPTDPRPAPSPDAVAATRALLDDAVLVDTHNDLPWKARTQAAYDWDALDLGTRLATTCTDVPRLRAGGVGAQFWSVYVPSSLPEPEAVVATLEQVAAVRSMCARYPRDLALATTADDVARAVADGRVASLLGAEGGHSIASSLGVLATLRALGVRYLTLTHNDNTPWADSATDEPRHGGLTAFGEDVVREMNRLGVIVDLSHVADTTMRAALRVTSAPVLFTHSNARAVCDVVRNVPGDVLDLVPGNGGVVCATFVPEFTTPAVARWRADAVEVARERGIDPKDWPAWTAFAREHVRAHPKPASTVHDVADHLDHLREAVGVDHVGIGGDFDGTDTYPQGLEDVSGYPVLLAVLRERGWSDADLRAVAGENVLRVLRAADDAADAAGAA